MTLRKIAILMSKNWQKLVIKNKDNFWQFCWKKWQFLAILLKKMTVFDIFFWQFWQFCGKMSSFWQFFHIHMAVSRVVMYVLTLCAFLLKKALHDSQLTALKLYPSALSPHTRHSLSFLPGDMDDTDMLDDEHGPSWGVKHSEQVNTGQRAT